MCLDLLVANPWVQPGVCDIHGQVGDHQQQRIQQHRTHDDRIVPVVDAVHKMLAHPIDAEDLLHHERARDDGRKQGAQDGDDGDQGVLQGVPDDVVQKLLEQCNSIKIKRIFLYLAEKLELPCFKRLILKKMNLGKGKRVIVKGGKLDTKYNITIPIETEENPF